VVLSVKHFRREIYFLTVIGMIKQCQVTFLTSTKVGSFSYI